MTAQVSSDLNYDRRWFDRLRARTLVNERGCFVWQGPVNAKGYICCHHKQWKNWAHRNVYRLLKNADIRTQDLVCHTCDNPRCWNIDHLFLGTARDNNRDCSRKGRHHNTVKTKCKWGHEYTAENTWLCSQGLRHCRTCARLRMQKPEYRARSMEATRRRRAQLKEAKQQGNSHGG